MSEAPDLMAALRASIPHRDTPDTTGGDTSMSTTKQHASPHCACGVNDAGQAYVDPICATAGPTSMSGAARYRAKHPTVEAKRFTGLDSYLTIHAWMLVSESTYADEARFATPLMLLQTGQGTAVARPGDWIVKDSAGAFHVLTAEIFAATYDLAGDDQ